MMINWTIALKSESVGDETWSPILKSYYGFLCPRDKIHQGKKFAYDASIILDFHCHNVTMAIVDCWGKIGSGEGNLLRTVAVVNGRQQRSIKVGRVKKVEIDSCVEDRFTWVVHFHYSPIEGRSAARMVADTGRFSPPICPSGICICHGRDEVGIKQ